VSVVQRSLSLNSCKFAAVDTALELITGSATDLGPGDLYAGSIVVCGNGDTGLRQFADTISDTGICACGAGGATVSADFVEVAATRGRTGVGTGSASHTYTYYLTIDQASAIRFSLDESGAGDNTWEFKNLTITINFY
jgi:hypothetical protein